MCKSFNLKISYRSHFPHKLGIGLRQCCVFLEDLFSSSRYLKEKEQCPRSWPCGLVLVPKSLFLSLALGAQSLALVLILR